MNNVDLELSKQIEEEVKQNNKGCIIRPSVAVIQIGDDEFCNRQIKLKEEACSRTGIYFRYF